MQAQDRPTPDDQRAGRAQESDAKQSVPQQTGKSGAEQIDSLPLADDEAPPQPIADVLQMIDRVRCYGAGSESAIFSAADDPGAEQVDLPTPARSLDETPHTDGELLSAAVVPTRIGRFEIQRKLGEGGYGLVFLANDPRLKRQVAIKIPRPQVLMTSHLRARFLREAEAAAAVDHPHIVPVFEVGSADGIAYIAYAYCQGVTLAEWLREQPGPVDSRTAARLIATLAAAVHHAHCRGVLHRDLKPANVLLETDGESTTDANREQQLARSARVTDFGLAKLEASDSETTASGSIIGTPAYLSPEQTEGGRVGIGPAADVHALGVILFELLTRQTPFRRDSSLATLDAVRQEPAPSPRRLNPAVPSDLAAICLKCLEKEPHRRYGSAEALADDLHRWLVGRPITARPVSSLSRGLMWCRRKPLLAGLVTALCASLIVGAAGIGWNWYQVRQANAELAESNGHLLAARDEAERNFQDALAAVDEYLTQVSESDLLRRPGLQPLREQLLRSALEYYDKFIAAHGNDPKVRYETAAACLRIGKIVSDIGSKQDALEKLQRGKQLAEQLFAETKSKQNRTLLGELYLRNAGVENQLGEREKAQKLLNDAIRLLETAAESNDPDVRKLLVQSYGYLGMVLRQTGQFPAALKAFDQSIAVNESLLAEFPRDPRYLKTMSVSQGNRANALIQSGDTNGGRNGMRRTIELDKQLVEVEPQVVVHRENLATGYQNFATLCMFCNQPEEGLEAIGEAVRIGEQLYRENPAVTEYQNSLAMSYMSLANIQSQLDLPDAQATRDRAFPLLSELRKTHPEIANYAIVLAAYHQDTATYLNRDSRHDAEALAGHERAIALLREVLEQDPKNGRAKSVLAISLSNAARSLDRQESYQRALEFFSESLSLPLGPNEASVRAGFARTLAHAGDHSRALTELESLPWEQVRPKVHYLAACVYALASEDAGQDESTRRELAERAVELLKSAAKRGYFRKQRRVAQLREEDDLRSLRDHAGFQDWLETLPAPTG